MSFKTNKAGGRILEVPRETVASHTIVHIRRTVEGAKHSLKRTPERRDPGIPDRLAALPNGRAFR
jgi:hypothetical protein